MLLELGKVHSNENGDDKMMKALPKWKFEMYNIIVRMAKFGPLLSHEGDFSTLKICGVLVYSFMLLCCYYYWHWSCLIIFLSRFSQEQRILVLYTFCCVF